VEHLHKSTLLIKTWHLAAVEAVMEETVKETQKAAAVVQVVTMVLVVMVGLMAIIQAKVALAAVQGVAVAHSTQMAVKAAV
jgi:hypothetical protein